MMRILLAAFTFTAFVGLSTGGLCAGDLKQNIYAQKLAAQKLTQQADDAIERSRKQDPAEAKFALQTVLQRVKDSGDLTDAEKGKLVTRLQARLNGVQETVRAKQIRDDQTPPRERPRSGSQPAGDPGKGGAYGAAKEIIGNTKNTANANSGLVRQREKGVIARGEQEFAPLPANGDISFPKGWKQICENRKKMVNVSLTEAEVKLLKALNSTFSPKYDNEKLSGVIGQLMDKTGLTIIVDPGSLQDANVDYETDTVSLQLPKVQVRTALKKILGDKGLTYIIKDGNIVVMTPKKASEYTVLRAYQVDDLVQVDPQIQMMFGPFAAQAARIQNGQALVAMLQSMTDSGYWAPNGPGSIAFVPPGSIVVRASAEMHYQLGSPGSFLGR